MSDYIHTVITSDTCPDLRCFVSDYIHTVITSDTCPDHRCFVSHTFYIIYSNFRYLSWSQVFRVKYLLYYIQYLEITVLITGVSCHIPFILYTVTSDTCPDHRCFLSHTFYIIYSNFRYLSWSQVFRVTYLLYYIQYLEIPVLITGVSCHIPFILYTVPWDNCPDHRCFVSHTFYIIYSTLR